MSQGADIGAHSPRSGVDTEHRLRLDGQPAQPGPGTPEGFRPRTYPQARAAVEAERQRLFSLLDALPALVYLKAPDYTIRFANRHFRERFGDPGTRPCYAVIHQRTTPCEPCACASVLEDRRPVEWEWTFPDGKSYQLHDYPFVDVDGTDLVLQLGMDITERRLAEAELERTNRELWALSQAEREERRFAEALAQAILAVNSSLDLAVVLDGILEQIQRVIPCRAALVMLLEGDRIHLARQRGLSVLPDDVERLRAGVPLETVPLLGAICQEGQPALIQDVARTSQWDPMSGLGWVRSLATAPLQRGQERIGLIALLSHQPEYFPQQSLQRLEAFASHAALAIQNAWLFERMRASREQLQSLSRRLVDTQENERRHVARELHDEVSQALTSLILRLKLLQRQAGDPGQVVAGTTELIHEVEEVMDNLHRLAVDLRPPSLDHLGLVPALRQYCRVVAATADSGQQVGLAIDVEAVGLEGRLPADVETVVYRIVQEALLNVVRHARATQATVLLERRGDRLVTVVEDNGQGFDPNTVTQKGRLGLLGMRERAESVGGSFCIESVPGGGTTVWVEVPCDG